MRGDVELKSVFLVVAAVLIVLVAACWLVVAAVALARWVERRRGRFEPLYSREWRDVPLVEKKK